MSDVDDNPIEGWPAKGVTMYRAHLEDCLRSKHGTLLNYRHGLSLTHLGAERWGWFWPLTWPQDWWEVTLGRTYPAIWQEPNGLLVMPDRHQKRCDLGSIPPPFRSRFPSTEFPFEYYMHDSSYGHKQVWTATGLVGPWTAQPVTREESDDRLYRMIATRQTGQPLNGSGLPERTFTRCELLQAAAHRAAIYRAVRTCGWAPWANKTPENSPVL